MNISYLLPMMVFMPFIGSLFCLKSYSNKNYYRVISLSIAVLLLLLSVIILVLQKENSFKPYKLFIDFKIPWIKIFNVNFHLAVDSLSTLMLIMTNTLGIISILCSWDEIKEKQNIFYFNLLLIIFSTVGIFLSIDLFLFFIFWEIMLIPTYFLIIYYGNKKSHIKDRIAASNQFLIYMQSSSLLLLISILFLVILHYNTYNTLSFDYYELTDIHLTKMNMLILSSLFIVACLIKMPIIPFHRWLSHISVHSPITGTVEISTLLTKISVYVLIKFVIQSLPKSYAQFSNIMLIIALFNMFYCNFMILLQKNIKKFISYTSIIHMSFIIIGIYSNKNVLSLHGVILYTISSSFSTAGLFVLCGQLNRRFGTFASNELYKHINKIKFMRSIFLFFIISNMSMPGTGNFIGEFLILIGSWKTLPIVTIISATNIITTTVYSVKMIKDIFCGSDVYCKSTLTMTKSEYILLIVLIILILSIGIYPQQIINMIN